MSPTLLTGRAKPALTGVADFLSLGTQNRGKRAPRYPPNPAIPVRTSASTSGTSINLEPVSAQGGHFRARTTVDSIMEAAMRHKQSNSKDGDDSTERAKFDDMTEYDVTEAQEEQLWRLEVERLFHHANSDSVLLFEGGGVLGSSDDGGFERLFNISEQLLCNLSICDHDDEVRLMEFYASLFIETECWRLQRILQERLNSDDTSKNPKRIENSNKRAYCAVVDYVTAVITRLSTRSIASELFHADCIAFLAKRAAKLKFLCKDSIGYAEISMDSAQSTANRVRAARHLEYHTTGYIRGATDEEDIYPLAGLESGSHKAFKPQEDIDSAQYYHEMTSIRRTLGAMLRNILVGLRGSNRRRVKDSGQSVNSFELSSLVYESGLACGPTLLTQDRDGDIGACSQGHCIQVSYNAFQLLIQTTEFLSKDQPTKRSELHENSSAYQWNWEEISDPPGIPKHGRFKSSDMDTAVSIIVPLLCTSAQCSTILMDAFHLVSILDDSDDPLETPGYTNFTALFSMKTDVYERSRSINPSGDVRSLSGTLLARQRLLHPDETWSRETQDLARKNSQSPREMVLATRKSFEELRKKIEQQWIIDQYSVTIRCGWYVWSVMGACFLLVVGGISVGLTVENRIKGVDPFNIATFCWVLAAFLIVIAKSVYVENWTWRDFLMRRCVCRSVKELATVTGISEQNVMMYLLHNEGSSILDTKGPFSTYFANRRKEGDGFSIDVKPTLRTLLLSGLVVLKVATSRGPALVSLNVRKGKNYVFFQNERRWTEDDAVLVCHELSQTQGRGSHGEGKYDFRMRREQIGWNRILGFYNVPETVFS